jgi:hypothetical protein
LEYNPLSHHTGGETVNFITYIQDHIEWSFRVFGGSVSTERLTNHIRKELDEIVAAPYDVEEWADVIILALDGAWRAGYSAEEICRALDVKQQKNKARTFIVPTDPNQPAEHDRTKET